MFEVFEHTADLGLRVVAPTLRELFADAARGLFAMIVANPQDVNTVEERTYQLRGDEADLLLFDWLNELLFTFETEHLLQREMDVTVDDSAEGGLLLTATCRGEPVDEKRHRMEHEVKAITYHGLVCERRGDGWFAELIVDI